MLHVDDGAEGFQTADVFDNGTSPDAATPWKGDPRVSQASEQGANTEKTGAKAVDQLVGRGRATELGGGEANAVRLPVDLNPQSFEDGAHAIDVCERGNVGQLNGLLTQEAGCHQHQGGVLRAADAKRSLQGVSAADIEALLETLLRRFCNGHHR